jgi:hypothetical protein
MKTACIQPLTLTAELLHSAPSTRKCCGRRDTSGDHDRCPRLLYSRSHTGRGPAPPAFVGQPQMPAREAEFERQQPRRPFATE